MSASVHRHTHEAMATRFELHLVHEDPLIANGAAQAIVRDIDRLESELSRFVSYSDISCINRAVAGESVRVDAACMDCLCFGRDVWAATGGAFDFTIGPLYEILRNPDGTPRRPGAEELSAATARCGCQHLDIIPEEMTVRPRVDGMRLDLGAIGKGYALDQAVFVLKEWGIGHALLNAGGSTVLGIGSMPGAEGWPVHAGGEEPVILRDNALSGTGFQQKGAHIVDPRTARMVDTRRILRWAIAPNATLADALSTAFMVMSKREISRFCQEHPGVSALFFR
jgi:thiamine biosynthesis lipoprotein